MVNKYSEEERAEALKLAEEIGPAEAARRLGMNVETICGWQNRAKIGESKSGYVWIYLYLFRVD